ncbi:MoeB/ThiF family adenylyltransferase [Gracilibacillus salinarum]|uniref:MoeB/ThiF family adenylyltransferase n=1 Tax=Gracilibacillus salinarum TaxID=2932255 RepID=A0ABY4GQH8_9BACI|nr:MoeB/ThiF family adenylyltransferase [Gracilibacillus salinarum]UOQ86605.1 MoeB/ThiF family adenylyltransferase [Gracilibacillus salinarum]
MDNRYHRQMLFEPIGESGQEQLAASHVGIVGAGALGSSNAEMLSRAGVGTITLIDRDYVELSNLQRQHLFTEQDAENRIPKAIAAKEKLKHINSETKVHALVEDLGAEELEKLISDFDVVIDATDNFETRFIINDCCQKYQKPWIYGGCVGSYGLTFTVMPETSPCLHCLMEHIPADGATCDTVGIISPAVHMVVAHQVAEVLKLLTGNLKVLSKKLVAFDMWSNQRSEINVENLKKEDCPSCGNQQYPYLSYDAQLKPAVLCGRNTVQIRPAAGKQFNLAQIKRNLEMNEALEPEANPYLLSFKVQSWRIVLFQDGRTFIHGTKDIQEAKKLYFRYIG